MFKVKEYNNIFFEHNTSLNNWEKRFDAIKSFEVVYDGNVKIGVINIEQKDDLISILLIALEIKYLRTGVGTKILEDIIKMYPNKVFELCVMKSNVRAVEFYLRNGFKITEEFIEDYGQNGKHESYKMIRK